MKLWFGSPHKYDVELFQVVSGGVECQKLLLAVANPVFRSLFHGPVKMNGKKVVNVQGTTYEAFSSLIKFIYNAPEYLPATADVKKMNDILNIAERYQVKQLAQEVETVIARFHIKTESNIDEPIKDKMENIRQPTNRQWYEWSSCSSCADQVRVNKILYRPSYSGES